MDPPTRLALLAVMVVCLGAGCGDDALTTQPGVDETPSTSMSAASTDETGVMPDLRGSTLNELGDGTGILYDLHEQIGLQHTINLPSNEVPEGVVFMQEPAPGTPLRDVTEWSVTVSAGGPAVGFADLPSHVADFASTLEGIDHTSLFVERQTELGTVYKHDDWLFGLDCDAVENAYRTFTDARYDSACPAP